MPLLLRSADDKDDSCLMKKGRPLAFMLMPHFMEPTLEKRDSAAPGGLWFSAGQEKTDRAWGGGTTGRGQDGSG